jgi:hypothetical protein
MPGPVRQQRRRSPPPAICRTCKEAFSSRNALFSHLGNTLHYLRSAIKSILRPIVVSKAQRRKVGTGTAFKDFNYCEVRYQLSPKSPDSESWGCADTGSGMSLVDESVLESCTLSSRKSKSPVHIKGVGDELYLSKESVVLDVFFPDVTNTRLAKITREFHIVQDMDCGLLVGNDIIEPEGIVINLAKKRMEISSCDNMACQLKVRRKKQTNHIVIRCAKETELQPWETLVPVRFPKLEKEYEFKGYRCLPNGCFFSPYFGFSQRLSGEKKELQIYNCSNKKVIIPKDYKLGYIELPDPPQYTPVKPVDVVQCHFRKAVDLRSSTVTNEAASVKATSPRQVTKKTSSALEKAPAAPPKSVRSLPPPPSLRTSVRPFPPVHSFVPLRRSSIFFYRPQIFFSFPPPSTTYQGNNDRLGFYSYLPCRRPPPSFPPKPGLQLQPLVKLFTCATNC